MKTAKKLLSKVAIKKGMFPTDIAFTPEEADRFLDYIIDQSVLKDHARMVKMAKSSRNLRAIGLSVGDVLWPEKVFGVGEKYKTSVVHDLIVLNSKKARGAAVVHDDDLEDNIEGEAFIDHLLKMIGAQIGNELALAYFLSTMVAGDDEPKTMLDVWNGWRHRILTGENKVTGKATVLDARSETDFTNKNGYIAEHTGDAPFDWEFKFSKALKSLPSKYKRLGLENFRFFMNDQLVQDYIDALAARATVLGDKAILGDGVIQYGKVPIVSAPLFPTDFPVFVSEGGDSTVAADAAAGQKAVSVGTGDGAKFTIGDYVWIHKPTLEYKSEIHKVASIDTDILTMEDNLEWAHTLADAEAVQEVTLDGCDCILTHKNNLIIGLQRDIKMETQREAAEESTYFFYSIRSDIAIENLNACVFIENLKVR